MNTFKDLTDHDKLLLVEAYLDGRLEHYANGVWVKVGSRKGGDLILLGDHAYRVARKVQTEA